MKYFLHYVLLIAGLLLKYTCSYSQKDPQEAKIRKENIGFKPDVIARLEYFFPGKSRFFFESNYNFNKEYYLLNGSYQLYNQIGYQHYASEKWTFGISEMYKIPYYPGIHSFITSVNLAHTGNIRSLHFVKEFSADHYYYLRTNNGYKAPQQARAGTGVLLGKKINIKNMDLFLSISGKMFFNHDFRDVSISIYSNRRVDLTRIRAEIYIKPKNKLWWGIFVMKETERYYILGGTDSAGNNFPDYRINKIVPAAGIMIHFVLNPEYAEKYLPGLPFRH